RKPIITQVPAQLDLGTVSYNQVIKYTARWDDQNLNTPAPLFTDYAVNLLSPYQDAESLFFGYFNQTSQAELLDKMGSMVVTQRHTCTGPVCTKPFTVTIDSAPQQTATYNAPPPVNPFTLEPQEIQWDDFP